MPRTELDILTKHRDISQTIVVIQVDDERFNLHKDLLIACSPYFRAAFEGGFKEAKDSILTLEDIKALTMQNFMDWLYFDQLPQHPDEIRSENDDTPFTTIEAYLGRFRLPFLDLYLFADRFDVPNLRKAFMELQHSYYTQNEICVPDYGEIILAFQRLPASSPLCRLLVDLYTLRWGPGHDDKREEGARRYAPAEFLEAVMTGIGQERQNMKREKGYVTPSIKPIEDYYERRAEGTSGKKGNGDNDSETAE